LHADPHATTGTDVLLNDEHGLNAYTTRDLRAGFGAEDQRWKFSIFGRNVTNEYIVTTVFNNSDARYRYTAKPVTYGATLSFKMWQRGKRRAWREPCPPSHLAP
jgi:iron complex outermembrane receptor protein